MVRIHPDPPRARELSGAVAQLGERLLCKQEVIGSIPFSSTRFLSIAAAFNPRGSARATSVESCIDL